jgi:lipopolysaccharide export LptBFGC system permease protein LptF
MKLLDRYILKQFFLSTLVALAGFVIIYIAIDMMEKLDKFLDKKVPAIDSSGRSDARLAFLCGKDVDEQ